MPTCFARWIGIGFCMRRRHGRRLLVMRGDQIGWLVRHVHVDVDDLLLAHRRDLSKILSLVGENVNTMITDDDFILQVNRECFDGFNTERTRVDSVHEIARTAVDDQQRVVVADEQRVEVLLEQRYLNRFVEQRARDTVLNVNLMLIVGRRRRRGFVDGEFCDVLALPVEKIECRRRRTVREASTGRFEKRIGG